MAGPQSLPDNGHEASAKIENSRSYKRDPDEPADNVTGGFNQKSGAAGADRLPDEARIRIAAYALWEADGRPFGDADRYWFEAIRALRLN